MYGVQDGHSIRMIPSCLRIDTAAAAVPSYATFRSCGSSAGGRRAGGCAGRRKASSGAAYSPAGRSVRPADEGCRERATASAGGGGASSGSGESFLSPSRYFCESELSQLRNCAPSVEAGREGRRGCLGPSRRLFGRGEEEAEREKEGEGREGSARLHTDSVRSSTLFEWRRRRLKLADGRLAR